MTFRSIAATVCILVAAARLVAVPLQDETRVPTGPLEFGFFVIEFKADGFFRLEGREWPEFVGAWKVSGTELVLQSIKATGDCVGPRRYRFEVEKERLHLKLVSD
jgi:hypothetical protein